MANISIHIFKRGASPARADFRVGTAHPCNEEQTLERSYNVYPHLMAYRVQVPFRKFPERLPTA